MLQIDDRYVVTDPALGLEAKVVGGSPDGFSTYRITTPNWQVYFDKWGGHVDREENVYRYVSIKGKLVGDVREDIAKDLIVDVIKAVEAKSFGIPRTQIIVEFRGFGTFIPGDC